MKVSRFLLKVWATMIIVTQMLLTHPLIAETRVGNGGIGLQSQSGTVLLDSLERGEHMVVSEEDAYQNYLKPRLDDLALSLPGTAEFLRSIFEERQSSWNARLTPRWYKVRRPLWRSNDRGPTPIIITSGREVQVALHTGDEIFVRDDILSQWSQRDAAMLYLHEGLISAVTEEGRYLEDTEVVRKLTGRIIHPEVLQADPESLALEFLSILNRHQRSPLYEVVRADHRAVRSVTPAVANPGGFVAECTESYSGDSIAKTYNKLLYISLDDEQTKAVNSLEYLEDQLLTLKSSYASTEYLIQFWLNTSRTANTSSARGAASRRLKKHRGTLEDLKRSINTTNERIDAERSKLAPYLERNRENCERAFRKFWHMSTIDLSGQDLDDISALAFFTEADHINISHNQIRDLTPLSSITALRTLNASHNKIEHVAALAQMQSLRSLDLGHNFIASFEGARFPSTVSIKLNGNFLSSLSNFEALEVRYLDLSHNKLTSSDLEHLDESRFPKLREVNVANNRVEDLFFVNEDWESLKVGDNEIKDLVGLPIGGQLFRLDVSGTKLRSISGQDLPAKLEELYVARTAIERLHIDARFPPLETLDVSASSTKVSVDRLDRPLRSLNISFNKAFDTKTLKHHFFSWLFDLDVTGTGMELNDYKNIWHMFELRTLAVSQVDLATLKSKFLVNLIKPHRSKAVPGEMVSLNVKYTE